MPKKKKTATSGELVMVKSVHRTRSRRMKFCVHGGLGDTLNKQHRKPNGYPGALLAGIASEERTIKAEKNKQARFTGTQCLCCTYWKNSV